MSVAHQMRNRMIVLGIDTSGAACSVALWENGIVLAKIQKKMMRGHAEALMPTIQFLFNRANIGYNDIGLISVTTGPGSFTGIRVGLATAQGLSLGLGIPICGVTVFEAIGMAAARRIHVKGINKLTVILETRRTDFFLQEFCIRNFEVIEAGDPRSASIESLIANIGKDIYIAGDGVERLKTHLPSPEHVKLVPSCEFPDSAIVAEIAAKTDSNAYKSAHPFYIHPPLATLPKKKGRVFNE